MIDLLRLACAAAALAVPALTQGPASAALWRPAAQVDPAARVREVRERQLRPQIVASEFVTLDLAALAACDPRSPLRPVFALPLGGLVRTLVVDSVERAWGHRVFRGHVDGIGHLVLAVGPAGVAAGALQIGAAAFAIESATGSGDLHVVHELDHDRMPATMGCGVDHRHEVRAAGGPATGTDDPSTPVLDVAVFYTPAARQGAGSAAAIESQIVSRVAVASDSSVRSGVGHLLRLVHAAETNYTETGTTTDLSRFRGTSDSSMREVHGLRDTYGADLMALIIEQSSQFCGVGYLMTNESTNFRSSAFSVTVRGCLDNDTLTHEMGHNMGLAHDRANAGGAVRPYAYGFRTADSRFRTIMAYSPGVRTAVWSGPNVTSGGYAMGTPTEDNARTLNEVSGTVAAFKPMTTYRWCEHGGGIASRYFGRPLLIGSGTTAAGTPVEVRLASVITGRAGALVIGAGGQDLPLFGGVLVPFVFDAIPVVAGTASATYDARAIRGLPTGAEVFFQAWIVEPNAPEGVSASDAVSVITI